MDSGQLCSRKVPLPLGIVELNKLLKRFWDWPFPSLKLMPTMDKLAFKKGPLLLGTAELKRLHQNKTRNSGSAGKGLDSQLCHYWELQTRKWAKSSLPGGSWEGVKSIPRLSSHTSGLVCTRSQSKYSWFVRLIWLYVLRPPFCTLTLGKLGQWGWLMRMRLAWKKSQKTLDTSRFCTMIIYNGPTKSPFTTHREYTCRTSKHNIFSSNIY